MKLSAAALAGIFLTGITVSGCTSLPDLPLGERGVSVDLIVDASKCELASVVKEFPKALEGWTAQVAFDLKVVQDTSGGPGVVLAVPYYAGPIVASAGLAATGVSNRAGKLAFVTALSDLKKYQCKSGGLNTGIPHSPYNLGLAEWMDAAVRSVSKPNDLVELSELTYTLEFILERTASGDISVKHVNATTNVGGKFARKDTNILVVTLASPPGKPTPTQVAIVSLPTPGGQVRQHGGRRSGAASRVDAASRRQLEEQDYKTRLLNTFSGPRNILSPLR